jgi:hypothetical protein
MAVAVAVLLGFALGALVVTVANLMTAIEERPKVDKSDPGIRGIPHVVSRVFAHGGREQLYGHRVGEIITLVTEIDPPAGTIVDLANFPRSGDTLGQYLEVRGTHEDRQDGRLNFYHYLQYLGPAPFVARVPSFELLVALKDRPPYSYRSHFLLPMEIDIARVSPFRPTEWPGSTRLDTDTSWSLAPFLVGAVGLAAFACLAIEAGLSALRWYRMNKNEIRELRSALKIAEVLRSDEMFRLTLDRISHCVPMDEKDWKAVEHAINADQPLTDAERERLRDIVNRAMQHRATVMGGSGNGIDIC